MDFCSKVYLLNDLAEPFGFAYLQSQDIITSRADAWQKEFGYCYLYDKSASHFNMVFDCEPIYFDYDGRTWLIEFWKGQYGINIGSEVGIYRADTIIPPEKYRDTLFHGVPDDEMLFTSVELYFNNEPLFCLYERNWWTTGFRMGRFCRPEELVMDVAITFPSRSMLLKFVGGLENAGYDSCEYCIFDLTVSLTFATPHSPQPRCLCKRHSYEYNNALQNCRCGKKICHLRLSAFISQIENRMLCKLFNWITKPFTHTVDQLLYLYYFLPVCFRKLLRFKKNRRQKFHKKGGERE